MPPARQDGQKRGPNGLSDIEGRMLVLEVVAMTSLALVLGTSDTDNPQIGRNILHLINEAVENKCEEMGLSDNAASTAQTYARELIGTVMAALFPGKH